MNKIIIEINNEAGLLHNRNGPALVREVENIIYTEYRLNGRLHRIDGPAYIEKSVKTNKNYEYYYVDGVFCENEIDYHRACIVYSKKMLDNEFKN